MISAAQGRLRALVAVVLTLGLSALLAACVSRAGAPETATAPAITATAGAASASSSVQPSTSASGRTSSPVAPGATSAPIVAPSPTADAPPPLRMPDASARVVTRGNAARREVALTFDAGSDPGYTGEILDVLQREGVRATFSVTGLWAEHNRELLLAIAAQGHQIINHTYDHASFTGLSTQKPPMTADARALELSRTEVTVYHLTERTTRPYFRPPYGDLDAGVQRDAAAAGYDTVVMWSVDTMGWNHASVEAIVARSIAGAEPGAIYVMHVGAESQDGVALPRIIAALRQQGYAFGTIADVLAP